MNKSTIRALQAQISYASEKALPPEDSIVFFSLSEEGDAQTVVSLEADGAHWYSAAAAPLSQAPEAPQWRRFDTGARSQLFVRADVVPSFLFLCDALYLSTPQDYDAYWRGVASFLLADAPALAEASPALEQALAFYHNDAADDWDAFTDILDALGELTTRGGRLVVPYEWSSDDFEQRRLGLRSLPADEDGEIVVPVFTSEAACAQGPETDALTIDSTALFETLMMLPEIDGIVLNPWGDGVRIDKDYLRQLLSHKVRLPHDNIIYVGVDVPEGLNADITVCHELPSAAHAPGSVWLSDQTTTPRKLHIALAPFSASEDCTAALHRGYWRALEALRAENLHSIVFPPLAITDDAFLEDAVKSILAVVEAWLSCNPSYFLALALLWHSEADADRCEQHWNALQDRASRILLHECQPLEDAIHFATERHRGACRKGTQLPYILHPLETMQILAAMNADPCLLAAGVLHDVLEDTATSLTELVARFGVDVAALVHRHTEDKRASWYIRKHLSIEDLAKASVRDKCLTLADKTANLRSMYHDYQRIGDALWQRFNAPMPLQAWYYSSLIDALDELRTLPQTRDTYWEMNNLYKDLFVLFLRDDEGGQLYQLSADGSHFMLEKGRPEWLPLDGAVPESAERLSRVAAEALEEAWNAPFWARHDADLQDGEYVLLTSANLQLEISIHDGVLTFTEITFADDGRMQPVYERLDADATHLFLTQLRLRNDLSAPLAAVLSDAFGSSDGKAAFDSFCQAAGIRPVPDVQ